MTQNCILSFRFRDTWYQLKPVWYWQPDPTHPSLFCQLHKHSDTRRGEKKRKWNCSKSWYRSDSRWDEVIYTSTT